MTDERIETGHGAAAGTAEIAAHPAGGPGARAGELAVAPPAWADAEVYFIGRIRTPWKARGDCPKKGDPEAGPLCRVELDRRWREGLAGLERHARIQLLYWMDQARRDLVVQAPTKGATAGTFALRSPVRPNPIASSVVTLLSVEGTVLTVRGLDCIDGTPLIDVKPEYCDHA